MTHARATAVATAVALSTACASSGGGGATVDAAEAPPIDAAAGAGDGFPSGAISFFLSTLCPSGWMPYGEAVGRTIVPVASADDAGDTAGTALAADEERVHRHDLAVGVDLPSVSYAGIAGEANHGVARSGSVTGTAATGDGTADVPYAQLRICRKQADAGDRPPPPRVIAFFDGACPQAWTPVASSLHGRYLVAAPAGATAASFGGAPLAAGELRTHTHPVSASVVAPSHGIALASGCCAGDYGGAGTHAATATATPTTVDMPYIQLSACQSP